MTQQPRAAGLPRYALYRISNTDPAAIRMRVSSDIPEWRVTLLNSALQVNIVPLVGTTWCMEGWFNFNRATAVWGLMSLMDSSTPKRAVTLGTNGGGALQLLNYIQAPIGISSQPDIGSWIHLAVVCRSGTCDVYHQGTLVFTTTPTNTSFSGLTTILSVGRVVDGDGYDWQGQVSFSHIRISNIRRYSSNFTPAFPLDNDNATVTLLRGNPVAGATVLGAGTVTYSSMPALGSYIP